jgi:hypothetical protein
MGHESIGFATTGRHTAGSTHFFNIDSQLFLHHGPPQPQKKFDTITLLPVNFGLPKFFNLTEENR